MAEDTRIHVDYYHGALVPIYPLPKVLPVCPLPAIRLLRPVSPQCRVLGSVAASYEGGDEGSLSRVQHQQGTLHEIRPTRKHLQLAPCRRLFHLSPQKSIGVAGVSDKYGKLSWARYPALWALKRVGSSPNPNPSDIEALDQNPIAAKDIVVYHDAEAKRPEFKRQAQEWAGISQDPNPNLFAFVGRWSKQKGVDLIADIMPSMYVLPFSVTLSRN